MLRPFLLKINEKPGISKQILAQKSIYKIGLINYILGPILQNPYFVQILLLLLP
jgi:hypothetical protein